MEEMIRVGVFWVCDDGGDPEIIWVRDEYASDWRSDFGDEFIVFEKGHKEVWKKAAESFFDGKYAKYNFNDFPRGRVTYDSEDGVYLVDCDKKLKKCLAEIKPALKEIFGYDKAVYQADPHLKSRRGRLNA